MKRSVKTRTQYVLVGSDYSQSQQEPRLMTAYSGDERLLDAYNNGKDMYATMGMGVYNNDYWDNMEHYEDGTPNIEGKKRRSLMKKLLLGLLSNFAPFLTSILCLVNILPFVRHLFSPS